MLRIAFIAFLAMGCTTSTGSVSGKNTTSDLSQAKSLSGPIIVTPTPTPTPIEPDYPYTKLKKRLLEILPLLKEGGANSPKDVAVIMTIGEMYKTVYSWLAMYNAMLDYSAMYIQFCPNCPESDFHNVYVGDRASKILRSDPGLQ